MILAYHFDHAAPTGMLIVNTNGLAVSSTGTVYEARKLDDLGFQSTWVNTGKTIALPDQLKTLFNEMAELQPAVKAVEEASREVRYDYIHKKKNEELMHQITKVENYLHGKEKTVQFNMNAIFKQMIDNGEV